MNNIIFFGTSEFAVPSLNALINDERFNLLGVVTGADQLMGRSLKMTDSPISKFCTDKKITCPIWKPESLKDESFVDWIKTVGKDCETFIIVSYGKFLPTWIIDLPKQGVLNVHPSLLPLWRGPSPLQATLHAGNDETGVSIMKIDAKMDHGPILAVMNYSVKPDDDYQSLHNTLADIGSNMLPNVVSGYLSGEIVPMEQDDSQVTFCKILSRDDGKIDWNNSAQSIHNMVRAYKTFPSAWTIFKNKRLKILSAKIGPSDQINDPGTFFVKNKTTFVVCGSGSSLELETIQLEGKTVITGSQFANSLNGR
jgi:methionyl-tRNA formyltransferase